MRIVSAADMPVEPSAALLLRLSPLPTTTSSSPSSSFLMHGYQIPFPQDSWIYLVQPNCEFRRICDVPVVNDHTCAVVTTINLYILFFNQIKGTGLGAVGFTLLAIGSSGGLL
jgi:hypothetical protein